MKETELRVDRIEEGLATLGENDAVVAATKLTEKTNAVKQDMHARLRRLFDERGI